jgi:hypothetical protein
MQCRTHHVDKTEGTNVANQEEIIRFSADDSADKSVSTSSKGHVPNEYKQHGFYASNIPT